MCPFFYEVLVQSLIIRALAAQASPQGKIFEGGLGRWWILKYYLLAACGYRSVERQVFKVLAGSPFDLFAPFRVTSATGAQLEDRLF